MTTISVMHDDQTVDTIEFGPDVASISIGRRPSNDICIADRSVSGRHARLDVDGNAVWIQDLDSTNGTYVNGHPVDRQRLGADDEVLVGKVQLRCHAAVAKADAVAAPLQQEMDDSFDESLAELGLAAVEDDDELDESMRAALALYSDESEPPAPAAELAVLEEDDDMDFSEDARLFAQSASATLSPDAMDDSMLPADEDVVPGDEEPLTLTDRAKVALGRQAANRQAGERDLDRDSGQGASRPRLHAVKGGSTAAAGQDAAYAASDHGDDVHGDRDDGDAPVAEPARATEQPSARKPVQTAARHRDDAERDRRPHRDARPLADNGDNTGPTHDLESSRSRGAVIQIKNGAKSGQILPIDKPVTTLGRPGIQIAAIMRKPDGYFLMHIESDDSVDRPTLNADSIGDEPVLLHSGDELNVAGIDVEFMLS